MGGWKYSVNIKHLFTNKEDHESIQGSMTAIAKELEKCPGFAGFSTKKFYRIPEGNDFFSSTEHANKLLEQMYDWADEYRIWIG